MKKKAMKKLSLTRETILDLGYFQVSGGAATVKPSICRACGGTTTETETTTTVNTTTVTTLGTAACGTAGACATADCTQT